MLVKYESFLGGMVLPTRASTLASLPTEIYSKLEFSRELAPRLASGPPQADMWTTYNKNTGQYFSTYRILIDHRSFLNIFLSGPKVQVKTGILSTLTQFKVEKEEIDIVIFPFLCTQIKQNGVTYTMSQLKSIPHDLAGIKSNIPSRIRGAIVVLPVASIESAVPEPHAAQQPISRIRFPPNGILEMRLLDRQQRVLEYDSEKKRSSIAKFMQGINVCNFIGNPLTIGLVLVKKTDPREIHACALFEKVPFASLEAKPTSRVLVEHVRLRHFHVDGLYGSCDVATQLAEAAYSHLISKCGKFPVVYYDTDRTVKNVLKKSNFIPYRSYSNPKSSVLLRSELQLFCSTVAECRELVDALYPAASSTVNMNRSSVLYTGERTAESPYLKPIPNVDYVDIRIGADILQKYYFDKFMPPGMELQSDIEASAEQAQMMKSVVTHIRAHLLRHYKHKTLTPLTNESLKFWPTRRRLSASESADGPEKYYLDGLNAWEPEHGIDLYRYPLGKKYTPSVLVEDPPERKVPSQGRVQSAITGAQAALQTRTSRVTEKVIVKGKGVLDNVTGNKFSVKRKEVAKTDGTDVSAEASTDTQAATQPTTQPTIQPDISKTMKAEATRIRKTHKIGQFSKATSVGDR